MGRAQYRAGDWDSALASLQKGPQEQDYNGCGVRFFLAMVHWRLGNKDEARRLYDQAVQETARFEKLLRSPPEHRSPISTPSDKGKNSVRSNWTPEKFQDAVREVKEHILAGDCYQVVLSQRFTKRVTAGPASIYRALRALNPSPYMYFFRLGDE